jgi:pullulanase
VRLHYHRAGGDYGGWTMYVYNAPGEANGGWPGKAPDGEDAFGKFWDVPVGGASFNFILVKDGGGTREPSNWSGRTGSDEQQFWDLSGGTEIFKLAGDATNYTSNPLGAATPDLHTVRVHYTRFDANYADWGVHIWGSSGLDVAGLKPGVVIDQWTNAVPFADFNNFSANAGEVVFDIPVLNPQGDASRTALEFIIHGKPPGGDPNDKDGRDNNIRVSYAALDIAGGVGEVWLIQGDATVYTSRPDARIASTTDARAYWLDRRLIQFPKVDGSGVFKLYHSATGQIRAAKDAPVDGADGSITLQVHGGALPAELAERFRFVDAGVVLAVAGADQAALPGLLTRQLVLVQENAQGEVQNATTRSCLACWTTSTPAPRRSTTWA